MTGIGALLGSYGYVALFAGTILEGEVVLILAGFAAHQGYLRLSWVILVAFAGAFCGDQGWFQLGRLRGAAFLERRSGWRPRVERVRGLVARHGTLIALVFRFLYGLRTVTPVALGMSGMPTARFLALDVVSTLSWAAVIGTGGYLFGHGLEAAAGNIRRVELETMAAIAAIGAVAWGLRLLRRKPRGDAGSRRGGDSSRRGGR